MPTGYTEKIISGEVQTPKDFLHLCLRAFGVCVNFKDEPLNTDKDYSKKILESYQNQIDYHKKFLKSAEEQMKKLESLSDDELYQKYVEEKSEEKKQCEDVICKYNSTNAKYAHFAEKIKNWECSPEYESVKNFALEQLSISKENIDYWEEELSKIGDLSREDFEQKKEEYLSSLKDSIQWEINYHQGQIELITSDQNKAINYYHFFKQEIEKLK